jgi:FMN phosphatase YigB (HAD superfamily)
MIGKRSLSTFFLVVNILVCPFIYGQEHAATAEAKKTAFSFDLDEVFSNSVHDRKHLKSLMVESPDSTTLHRIGHYYPAARAFYEKHEDVFEKHVTALADAQQKDYVHLFPNHQIVELIKDLKSQGYTVVAATNRRYRRYQKYCKSMKDFHNLNLQELFDASLTVGDEDDDDFSVDDEDDDDLDQLYDCPDKAKKVYVTCGGIRKPNGKYFAAVRDIVSKLNSEITTIIHIDDQVENVLGARESGFESISYKVKGGMESEVDDFRQAMKDLREKIKVYGIEV